MANNRTLKILNDASKIGRLLFSFALVFIFAWSTPALSQPLKLDRGNIGKQEARSTDRIIVKYKDGTSQSTSRGLSRGAINSMNSRSQQRLQYVRQMRSGAHVLKMSKFQSQEEAQKIAQRLQADPNIEYAEPDVMLQTLFEPNDPHYAQYQWHYSEIDGGINLPQAWDITDGSGAVVAVIDTGYLPHADLVNNILPGYDMISDSFVSRDGDGRDADATDAGDWTLQGECGNGLPAQDTNSTWHGTHVAGTIAAETDNNLGVAGVAYGAKILPVRALGRCGGYTSDISDAIVWAAGGAVNGVPTNTTPAQVLNLSFGGPGLCSFTFQNAVNTAHSLGSTIVVASGNSDADASDITPANCNNVVTVAATDRNGGKAYYSNYGTTVDVAAPGGDARLSAFDAILSTLNTGTTSAESDVYVFYQGTSMSAPHVSGVAALLYSQNPSISPNQVKDIISNSARDFPNSCNLCGAGIVDAYAALTYDSGSGNAIELENGVETNSLSGATGDELRYTLTVPEGATNLQFNLSDGTGDADLYVQFENEPTANSFDCGSYQLGNNETCLISNAQAGTYHILIHAYGSFSGATLVASYDEGGENTETFSAENLSAFWFSWLYYFVEIPEGATSLTVNTFGGTGDADLYLNPGTLPGTSNYTCSSSNFSTVETCTIDNPQAGTWYIGVRAALFFSGVSMSVQYTYN